MPGQERHVRPRPWPASAGVWADKAPIVQAAQPVRPTGAAPLPLSACSLGLSNVVDAGPVRRTGLYNSRRDKRRPAARRSRDRRSTAADVLPEALAVVAWALTACDHAQAAMCLRRRPNLRPAHASVGDVRNRSRRLAIAMRNWWLRRNETRGTVVALPLPGDPPLSRLLSAVVSIGVTVLTACTSATPVADLGDDTYAVTLTSAEGGPLLRQRAVDIGQTQCIQNSRYFYVVSENTQPSQNGTSLTLTFKCLRGTDPLMHRPDAFKTN